MVEATVINVLLGLIQIMFLVVGYFVRESIKDMRASINTNEENIDRLNRDMNDVRLAQLKNSDELKTLLFTELSKVRDIITANANTVTEIRVTVQNIERRLAERG